MRILLFAATAVSATTFTAKLGAKNGVCEETYDFRVVETSVQDGRYYGATMVAECRKYNMLPVCEDRQFCEHEPNESIYLGQDHHMSYIWRNPENGPPGFAEIAGNFKDMCFYTKWGHGEYPGQQPHAAMCSIGDSYAWRTTAQGPLKFMCARTHAKPDVKPDFVQLLGLSEGLCPYTWEFKKGRVCEGATNYSHTMIRECRKMGYRPICDHAKYCQDDPASLLLGVAGHMSLENGRIGQPLGYYIPPELHKIKDHWRGICNYAGNANNGMALCDTYPEGHGWYSPTGPYKEFMCGRVARKSSEVSFTHTLESFNGIPTTTYEFTNAKYDCPGNPGAWYHSYLNAMKLECMTYGMEPICEGGEYCRYNSESLFLGNTDHFFEIRFTDWNKGFEEMRAKWDYKCVYAPTVESNKKKTVCSENPKTHQHTWRTAALEGYKEFICGRVEGIDDDRTLPPVPTFKPTDIPTVNPTRSPTFAPTGVCEHLGGWTKKCKRISQNGGDWKPVCKSDDAPACGFCKAKRRKCKARFKCKKNKNQEKCQGVPICHWNGTKCKEKKE